MGLTTRLSAVLAILLRVTLTHGGSYDLCAVGQSIQSFINGNWTYMGIDSSNNDTEYWVHECYYDLHIAWGVKYWGPSWPYWLVVDSTTGGAYAQCGYYSTANPFDCNGFWYLWNGTSWVVDDQYFMDYCTVFESTDCSDKDYQTDLLDITDTNGYCITNVSVANLSIIIGEYKFGGCNNGMPYYQIITGEDIYITYSWCWATWQISNTIKPYWLWSECVSNNFADCGINSDHNADFWSYNGGWYLDNGTRFDTCQFPTTVCVCFLVFLFFLTMVVVTCLVKR